MKIDGAKAGVYEAIVVFPRGERSFVFKLKAVNPSDYNKVCPEPTPPNKTVPSPTGPRVVPHFDDKTYKQALFVWGSAQLNWMYIQTIKETPGLEWEKVNIDDPATFQHWQEELREFGLSVPEVNHLYEKMREVNGLSQAKLEEERERFLTASQEASNEQSSPKVEA